MLLANATSRERDMTPGTSDVIQRAREDFPFLEDRAYLNTAAVALGRSTSARCRG